MALAQSDVKEIRNVVFQLLKEQTYPERPDNALMMQMLAEIRSLREDTNHRFAETNKHIEQLREDTANKHIAAATGRYQ